MTSRIFIAALLLASLAQAKEPKHNQSGTLLQMDRPSAAWTKTAARALLENW
jgi:hypothetical protein